MTEETSLVMQLAGQIGIWTDYAPLEAPEVLEVVGTVGQSEVEGIEIFAEHLEYFQDEESELLDALSAAGLALSGVYYNVDHREADAYVDRAGDLAETMAAVGGDTLVVGAGREYDNGETRTTEDFEAMAVLLEGIAGVAADHGIDTVVHPHRGQLVETPADLEAVLDAGLDTDAVGLCPHATHQVAADVDPYAIYESYPEWVRYLHVSDVTEDGDGAVMGEGILDQHRLHDPIFEAGYDGWIVVEGRTDRLPTDEYVARTRDVLEAEFLDGEGWE